jgi:hypothetical protein
VTLERRVGAAVSWEWAVVEVAQLLRTELGARDVTVLRVHAVDANGVRCSELLHAHPHWHAGESRRRDASQPAGVAARTASVSGDAARGWAVPLQGAQRVEALLCLSEPVLAVPAEALQRLLERARACLSQALQCAAAHDACPAPGPSVPPAHREVSHAPPVAVAAAAPRRRMSARMWCRVGRPGPWRRRRRTASRPGRTRPGAAGVPVGDNPRWRWRRGRRAASRSPGRLGQTGVRDDG